MGAITKAVIPVAGLGTRLLPATKSIPKEMLPVVDKPAIQYVVEEAVKAGLQHVLMVTGRNKSVLENHFDRAVEIEASLLGSGDVEKLNAVEQATNLADIHYVRQGNPNGLGHAILRAESFVGNEAFAVLLGDDLIDEPETLLEDMIEIAGKHNASVVALMEIPESKISNFGVAAVSKFLEEGIVEVSGFIEKPILGEAPSNFAIIGRYVLQPGIMEIIRKITPKHGQEIQLTDALNTMAKDPSAAGKIIGLIYTGKRYDIGNRLGYLQSIVQVALLNEDLKIDFSKWLLELSDQIKKTI